MNFVPEVFLRQWRGLEEESKPSIAAAVVVCGRERERALHILEWSPRVPFFLKKNWYSYP